MAKNLNSELLPCPLCGGEAEYSYPIMIGTPHDTIGCTSCKITTARYEGKRHVTKLWNTRNVNNRLDFDRLRHANQARNKEWDPENKVSLTYRGNELAGETGEACNLIKKIERERLDIPGTRTDKKELAKELADVIICADLIAMDENIDLDEAVSKKFNATSEKYGLNTKL